MLRRYLLFFLLFPHSSLLSAGTELNHNPFHRYSEDDVSINPRSSTYSTIKLTFKETEQKVKVFIHYPTHKKAFAQNTQEVAEKYFPQIHQYFDYLPKDDVHIVIPMRNVTANGAALVFPRNQIILHDYPPLGFGDLTAAKDWIRTLVVHEYVHIVTLEMTRGVLSFFRNFFGATVKFNGIQPRWLAEGVATWAESFFTREGRLSNILIQQQMVHLLKDPDFCQSIDCIGHTRSFPFVSYAYWAGAFFTDYLEQVKEGNLACIFKKNSGKLPFMWNSTFEYCTGKDVAENWEEFKEHYLNKHANLANYCWWEDEDFCREQIYKDQRIKPSTINWSKGFIRNENFLVLVLNTGETGRSVETYAEFLLIKNLKTSEIRKVYFDYPIEKIYPLFHSSDIQRDLQKFLITTFSFKSGFMQREHHSFDLSKMKLSKLSKGKQEANRAYYFPYKDKTWLELQYQKSRWQLNIIDGKKENVARVFPASEAIFLPGLERKSDGSIVFSYQTEPATNIQSQRSQLTKPRKVINLNEEISQSSDQGKIKKQNPTKSYQGWRYLDPTYLMLMYGDFGNISFINFLTSLQDPLAVHNLSLSGNYYFGLEDDRSPYGGNVGYSYRFADFRLFTGYNRFLSQSSLTNQTNSFESYQGGGSWQYFINKYAGSLGVTYSRAKDQDLFGRRTIQRYGIANSFTLNSFSPVTFFQSAAHSISLAQNESEGRDQFLSLLTRLDLNFRFSRDMRARWDTSYGRYFKEDFTSDILYGGGASNAFSGNFFFESYAIFFQDMLGNEILTSRVELENTLSYVFSGSDLLPFYTKEFRVFYGGEVAQADRIFVANRLERDAQVYSAHLGFRILADIFYQFPLEIDLVVAKPLNKQGSDMVTQLLLKAFAWP